MRGVGSVCVRCRPTGAALCVCVCERGSSETQIKLLA